MRKCRKKIVLCAQFPAMLACQLCAMPNFLTPAWAMSGPEVGFRHETALLFTTHFLWENSGFVFPHVFFYSLTVIFSHHIFTLKIACGSSAYKKFSGPASTSRLHHTVLNIDWSNVVTMYLPYSGLLRWKVPSPSSSGEAVTTTPSGKSCQHSFDYIAYKTNWKA